MKAIILGTLFLTLLSCGKDNNSGGGDPQRVYTLPYTVPDIGDQLVGYWVEDQCHDTQLIERGGNRRGNPREIAPRRVKERFEMRFYDATTYMNYSEGDVRLGGVQYFDRCERGFMVGDRDKMEHYRLSAQGLEISNVRRGTYRSQPITILGPDLIEIKGKRLVRVNRDPYIN